MSWSAGGVRADVTKWALVTGLALGLAACATTPGPRANGTVPKTPASAASGAALQTPGVDTGGVASSQRTRFVGNATALIGQPYRYGGAEPGGFDCSGLVVYAASGAGLRLPRTAHEQMRAGVPVARHDLQPGDLVFMHLTHKELHVGIAIDGNRFVHAPSTGGFVRIDSLGATPYARGFLQARRVVGVAAIATP